MVSRGLQVRHPRTASNSVAPGTLYNLLTYFITHYYASLEHQNSTVNYRNGHVEGRGCEIGITGFNFKVKFRAKKPLNLSTYQKRLLHNKPK